MIIMVTHAVQSVGLELALLMLVFKMMPLAGKNFTNTLFI
jgi:hypothetical protein